MTTRRRAGRRWAAALLCACLLAGLLPGLALAAEVPEDCSAGLDLTSVMGDKEYTAGGGTALWDYDSRTLTLNNAVINNTTGEVGICYYDVSNALTVVVRGACSVSGTKFGILGLAGLTVEVGAGASLTAAATQGGNYSAGLGAGCYPDNVSVGGGGPIPLKVAVAPGGTLAASGENGIHNGEGDGFGSIEIENQGTLTAASTGAGYGVNCGNGSVRLGGGGLTLCAGDGYGVWGGTDVIVESGVRGLAAGGNGGLYSDAGADKVTNNAGGGFLVLDRAVADVDKLAAVDAAGRPGGWT